jgi:DNA polymerase-4
VSVGAAGLCRDCGATVADPNTERCADCASPRLTLHPELFDLTIAHLDCDAFYAAVEKRDDPSLQDRPVIIGGGKRGVVSTACYIARLYGVGSAMPMFKALEACPDAVVLRPDMAKYQAVGREVREMMRATTPLIQPLSIDEAYLDLTELDAARALVSLASSIEDKIGITVSIGLSYNKFLAKLASDLDKPRGFSVVGREEARGFLAPLPVRKIWGVGPALAKRLQRDGINRIGQLQGRDAEDLGRRYGSIGRQLAYFAIGEDKRSVEPRGKSKSVSVETTFASDTGDLDELAAKLEKLCDRLAERLARADLAGQTVVLKLKSSDFTLRTRSVTLGAPTGRASVLSQAGQTLLAREIDGTKFRLLGIGVAKLTDASKADPPDMLDLSR